MNTKTRILSSVALAAGFLAGAGQVNAAGLLGQRYFGATFDYAFVSEDLNVDGTQGGIDDATGLSLLYNQPIRDSLDLGIEYSYLTTDFGASDGEYVLNGDISMHEIYAGVTWFSAKRDKMKPFVTGALGWMKTEADADAGGENYNESDSSFAWLARAGIEFGIGDRIALAPVIEYADPLESGADGTFSYGGYAEFELNKLSFVGRVMIDDESNTTVSAGLTFGF